MSILDGKSRMVPRFSPVKKTYKVVDKKGQLLVRHNVVSVTPMKNYD